MNDEVRKATRHDTARIELFPCLNWNAAFLLNHPQAIWCQQLKETLTTNKLVLKPQKTTESSSKCKCNTTIQSNRAC
jgi:hypothetical protein